MVVAIKFEINVIAISNVTIYGKYILKKIQILWSNGKLQGCQSMGVNKSKIFRVMSDCNDASCLRWFEF